MEIKELARKGKWFIKRAERHFDSKDPIHQSQSNAAFLFALEFVSFFGITFKV